MRRCLQLARLGKGTALPNPYTGAIIVQKGRIIGEGWHRAPGTAHAEVVAIENARQRGYDLTRPGTTLYVNLEPCVHYGRTPPCVSAIVQAGIPRVVFAHRDPNPRVNGNGLQQLREAGVEVIEGVLEEEARWLNRRFITFQERQRPYVILKWAQTVNGFMAPAHSGSYWITHPLARQLVHKWRAEEMAILVGYRTALNDDPRLTVRYWKGRNPIRVVLDPKGELPPTLSIFDDQASVFWVLDKQATPAWHKDHVTVLRINYRAHWVEELLGHLYDHQIVSLLVEGGAATLQAFQKANLWDEARIFVHERSLWLHGLQAPPFQGTLLRVEQVSPRDRLYRFVNRQNLGQ